MRTKLFYDAEFTGLQQNTQLISLALCTEAGRAFYAEFTDFNRQRCDPWIQTEVLAATRWTENPDIRPFSRQEGQLSLCFGTSAQIKQALLAWLSVYERVEIWADCLAWDWVLFCELFGGALALPTPIFYMPFDLVTLLHCKGLDADISRLEFVQSHGLALDAKPIHNALFDAQLTRDCYRLLMA